MIKLIKGDCLKEMKKLKDNSIDLILTDPPYGTNDGKGKVIRRGKEDVGFCEIEWDKQIDLSYLPEIFRIMKDDKWGVIFTDNMYISFLWQALENNNLKPRNTFYWIKHNKAPTPRCNFKSCVETAIVFTKGRTNKSWYGGGNQNNYILMPFVSGKEKVNHPTQKPVKLMEFFIQLFTNKNDLILDPFGGSMTTCVASKRLGRNCIGIELNEEYIKLAKERLRGTPEPLF